MGQIFYCHSYCPHYLPKAREGDYEMMSVCACVRALVSHADFSKTTTATDFL